MTLGSGLTTLSRQFTNLGINTEINKVSLAPFTSFTFC
jgi:hypothetical protein